MNIIIYLTIATAFFPFLLFIISRKKTKKNNQEKIARTHEKTIDLQQQNYLDEYSRQIKYRSKLFTYSLFIISLIGPVWFFIYAVSETNAIGKVSLGLERYTSRMNDSYLYSLILFGLLIIMVSPIILLFRSYLQRYTDIITTLSGKDVLKVKLVNDRLSSFDKYMPPYIIRDKTVIIFHVFRGEMILKFEEINSMTVKKINAKSGFHYQFTVITRTGKKQFSLKENIFLKKNLITEILNANPNVKINDNE